MSNPSPNPDPKNETGSESRLRPDRQAIPGLPRWVKAAAIIAIVLIGAFVIVHLAGGGFRGHAPLIQYWAPRP
jgi:hypothetical protein